MAVVIFTHPSCRYYTVSPLHMYEHLQKAHPASTKATEATLGPSGLDSTISRFRLHSSPYPAATRVYICITCQLLHASSFDAHAHLERSRAHTLHVERANRNRGASGISSLLTVAWSESLDTVPAGPEVRHIFNNQVHVNQEIGGMNIGPVDDHPDIDDPTNSIINMALTVANYTKRDQFPPRLMLHLQVPRRARTVDDLARCVEDAFINVGGPRDKIEWGGMIRDAGMSAGGMQLKSDGQVRQWVRAAWAREVGMLDGGEDEEEEEEEELEV